MERWIGKVALVTGASAGIGAALCDRLVKQGMKVVGVARNIEKIQEKAAELSNAPGSLVGMKCDLCKDEEVYKVFEEIQIRFGGVDICVNNAGNLIYNPLLAGSPSEWRANMDLNVIALCLCTKLAVQSMKERDVEGHIINISSIVGHYVAANSGIHFYSATKFAVNALTQGIRMELREEKNYKIRVTCFSPGVVKTEFFDRNINHGPFKDHLNATAGLTADDAALLITNAIALPQNVDLNEMIVRTTEAKRY